MKDKSEYRVIVIGASAGGLYALSAIFEKLPENFPFPVLVVQHRSRDHNELLEEVLQSKCRIKIKQADEKEKLKSGIVYIAPPDYHLLIEEDDTLSLSSDPPVWYSRPSIDVLFESASEIYKEKLIGIILTGANSDGASGIRAIKNGGGITIAQSLDEADFVYMPRAAIETKAVTHIWKIEEIYTYLLHLSQKQNE